MHPGDDVWRGFLDESGRRYYCNAARGENVWSLPEGVEEFVDVKSGEVVKRVEEGEGEVREEEVREEEVREEEEEEEEEDSLKRAMELDLGGGPSSSLGQEGDPPTTTTTTPTVNAVVRDPAAGGDENTVSEAGKPLAFELKPSQVCPPPHVPGGGGGLVGGLVSLGFKVLTAGGAGALAVAGMAAAAADEGRLEAIRSAVEAFRYAQ